VTGHLSSVGDGDIGESDARISAYLDNELTATEVSEFEADLGADADLASELESVGAIRAALRGLGDVIPRRDLMEIGPTSTSEQPGVARRWAATGAVAIVAVAAVWLVLALLLFDDGGSTVVPALDDLVGQHELASDLGTGAAFVPMERDEVDMAMKAPDDVGGMGMGGVFQNDEIVQVIYTDGDHNVSVFHQPGQVSWDDMPPGEMMEMSGNQAWHATMHGADVIVLDSDDGVVTIVADGDMATSVAEALTA
jgi:hypothetical protein